MQDFSIAHQFKESLLLNNDLGCVIFHSLLGHLFIDYASQENVSLWGMVEMLLPIFCS